MHYHPALKENGEKVVLKNPDLPSPVECWANRDLVACTIPEGKMPTAVCGQAILSWATAPKHAEDWLTLADSHAIAEPEFNCPLGLKAAAGVVIREPDGRYWLVAPSNGFGGYKTTFPKGTQEVGLSLQASAIKEAFEESGLQVRLTGFLLDIARSASYTRYYTACRIGGNPADMGWESQAVLLVPETALTQYLTNAYDQPLLEMLHTCAQ